MVAFEEMSRVGNASLQASHDDMMLLSQNWLL